MRGPCCTDGHRAGADPDNRPRVQPGDDPDLGVGQRTEWLRRHLFQAAAHHHSLPDTGLGDRRREVELLLPDEVHRSPTGGVDVRRDEALGLGHQLAHRPGIVTVDVDVRGLAALAVDHREREGHGNPP
ncbi:hypothetical protein BACI9J_880001 [Bacillus altitudinis]|nr:hypothetical protein BACI9J_880001 [Bacillus altitudinis]